MFAARWSGSASRLTGVHQNWSAAPTGDRCRGVQERGASLWGMITLVHTIDGVRILLFREIDAPAELVWELFVDTRRWPEWGPSVTDVECPDRRISTGSSGRVRTVGGYWLPFAITHCADYRWSWRIGPIPATGHRVESTGSRCRAAFEIPLYAALYVPVCWWALRKIEALASGR